MFKDAEVGDRVWSVVHGWGTVFECCDRSQLRIRVKFPDVDIPVAYTREGVSSVVYTELPTLFWDEVKIIPPPKPKRRVKKLVEGWVSLCFDGHSVVVRGVGMHPHIHTNAADARAACAYPIVGVFPVSYKYEVAE